MQHFTNKLIVLCLLVTSVAYAQHSATNSNSESNASDIWELDAELMRTEEVTSLALEPVIAQLKSKIGQTESSLSASIQERLRLQAAQRRLANLFNRLSKSEQQAYLSKISARPKEQLLIYDFPPFRELIPRFAMIRESQRLALNYNFAVRPLERKSIQLGEIEVDPQVEIEINGSRFPNNHFSLTFDDGPNLSTTSAILDSLADWGIRANFFILGEQLELPENDAQNLLTTMVLAGHRVENHSWSHPEFTRLPDSEIAPQVQNTNALIESLLAAFSYRQFLFRFPYGARNTRLKNLVHSMGYTSVMWNIDTLDWKFRDPQEIIDITAPQIEQRGKGIILMHDIHTQTMLAVPHIIDILSERNATMVYLKTLEP